jgi:lipid-binding SYLF domain-containing protein
MAPPGMRGIPDPAAQADAHAWLNAEVSMLTQIHIDRRAALTVVLGAVVGVSTPQSASAVSRADLSARASSALHSLYASSDKARQIGRKAEAVLVFPAIGKGGFIVGAESGNGAMLVHGRAVGFYNISAASFGFQAGIQKFSYALFFITPSAINYLRNSKGWSIGSGPSVVVVDQGFAKNFNTTTLTQDVYAFAFGQKGLMGGISLQGSKITPINPGP